MECLKDIIGITQSDCDCIVNSLTPEQRADIKVSTSGFYMDNIPDALSLSAIKHIDSCFSFYTMSKTAKDTAITQLQDDIVAGLEVKYKSSKGSFFGTIGRSQYAGNLQASKAFQFLKVEPNGKTDAVINFKKARVYSSASGGSKFHIMASINGDDPESIWELPITLVANNAVVITPSSPMLLPMDQNGQSVTYFFAWETVNGSVPKDNKIDCNCPNGGAGFENYVHAVGGQTDAMIDANQVSTDNKAHGVVIDVEIKCMASNFICREYNDKNAIAVVSKWAVAYKANEFLIERILGSPEVNKYTLMSREYLYGKRNHFRSEYATRLQYILDTIDVAKTDCFICKQSTITVGGILS